MEPRETGLLGTSPIFSKGYCNSERVAEGGRPQEWWGWDLESRGQKTRG